MRPEQQLQRQSMEQLVLNPRSSIVRRLVYPPRFSLQQVQVYPKLELARHPKLQEEYPTSLILRQEGCFR